MRAAPRRLKPISCPTARRNGAAPNRADSQGAGLADGEASDQIPLRGVRGPTLDTKNRRSQKTEGLNQSQISGSSTSRAAPARPRVHGVIHRPRTQKSRRICCGGAVYLTERGGALLTPTARQEARATDKARGCLRSPSAPSRQQQFFAWTTRCSRAPRRARRPGRTNSS